MPDEANTTDDRREAWRELITFIETNGVPDHARGYYLPDRLGVRGRLADLHLRATESGGYNFVRAIPLPGRGFVDADPETPEYHAVAAYESIRKLDGRFHVTVGAMDHLRRAAWGSDASPARHGPDFRSVHWYGKDHSFTRNQAACVRVLWQAWEQDTPDVGDQKLIQVTDAGDKQRLRDVFKNNAAWGTMIIPGKYRDTRRLAEPLRKKRDSREIPASPPT